MHNDASTSVGAPLPPTPLHTDPLQALERSTVRRREGHPGRDSTRWDVWPIEHAAHRYYLVAFQRNAVANLTHDTLVGCGWAGVSFRWYCGVRGLVVGH